jgi:hypothetical protein
MKDIASIVAAAWDQALEESPAPDFSDVFGEYLGGRRPSYRERLDAPTFNYRGARIPQIVIVRHNLARLGKPKRPPQLPE